MHVIINHIISSLEQGEPAVIGAIIKSTGSAPRNSGARMLVRPDGSLAGTIGGGEMEGACITAALDLMNTSARKHTILDYNLSTSEAADAGMVCGGKQQVLLQRLDPLPENLSLFQELQYQLDNRSRPVLLTLLSQSAEPKMQIFNSNLPLSTRLLKKLEPKVSRANQPFTVETDGTLIFAEPLTRTRTIHLAGAGHVSQAVATIASTVGFGVRVMDDRAEFANRERFANADSIEVVDDFASCLGNLNPDDMVVIVTRGHQHDREVLRQALHSQAGYIGMIGSRHKRDATYGALKEEGFNSMDFQRVSCPIGLDLGGDSPAEIALSIIAQLQMVRTGRMP